MGGISSLKNLKSALPRSLRSEGRASPQTRSPQDTSPQDTRPPAALDADRPPHDIVSDSIQEFCSIDAALQEGREVALLPVIVETTGSGPGAVAAAVFRLRKYLTSSHDARPYEQYNAIMLLRILVKNPGKPFTSQLDAKFVNTIKKLLKDNPYFNVQHIMRQSLDMWETETGTRDDEGLAPLISMWRAIKDKEKKNPSKNIPRYIPGNDAHNHGRIPIDYPAAGQQPTGSLPAHGSRPHSSHRLPSQAELASRVEEAKNTAKVFLQMIQSAPPAQIADDDLMKEFYSRCQSAQKGMQSYINCDNPSADDDTMQTLIEVNEQLSLSMSRYQRAKLQASRMTTSQPSTPQPDPTANAGHRPSSNQVLPSQNTSSSPPQGFQAPTYPPPQPQSHQPSQAQAYQVSQTVSLLDNDRAPSGPAITQSNQNQASYPVTQQSHPNNGGYRSSLGTPAPEQARPLYIPPDPKAASTTRQLDSPGSPSHLRSPFSDEAEVSTFAQDTDHSWQPPSRAPPPPRLDNANVNGARSNDDEDDLYAVSPVREQTVTPGHVS